MFKLIFTITLMGFFMTSFSQQSHGADDSLVIKEKTKDTYVSSPLLTDSVFNIKDPKKGFKNLYVAGTGSNSLNSSQLNPMAISFVEDYMQKHRKNLENLKGWGRPYFDMMDAILTLHGLPRELKYLAVIESYLKTYAVSWAGAVGPWQFMPATARRMGLRVNNYYDERTDYYKSTHAAARYLTELYKIFNDWLLVIAAYNGGPGNVNRAIRVSKSTDFWTLQYFLPAESRNHVKKFIATHYIMEGEGGVTTLTRKETSDLKLASDKNTALLNLSAAERENSKTQTLSGKYNSLVIAKQIAFPVTEFNRYNPDFDKLISLNDKYELRLPAEKMEIFNARRHEILNESFQVLLNEFRQSLSSPGKKN
jgi:membrane-bound lytic murein transglycosylase D